MANPKTVVTNNKIKIEEPGKKGQITRQYNVTEETTMIQGETKSDKMIQKETTIKKQRTPWFAQRWIVVEEAMGCIDLEGVAARKAAYLSGWN